MAELPAFTFFSLTPGYDYYMLLPEDREYVEYVDGLGLRILSYASAEGVNLPGAVWLVAADKA